MLPIPHNEGGPIPKDIKIDFIVLAKPRYLSKDGTVRKGIEMDGLFYAPKEDLPT